MRPFLSLLLNLMVWETIKGAIALIGRCCVRAAAALPINAMALVEGSCGLGLACKVIQVASLLGALDPYHASAVHLL